MASYVFKENAVQVGDYSRIVNVSLFSDFLFELAESSLCHEGIFLTSLLDGNGQLLDSYLLLNTQTLIFFFVGYL